VRSEARSAPALPGGAETPATGHRTGRVPLVSHRKTDWATVALLASMYLVLIGNFACYLLAPLPLLVHIMISTIAIHLAFTIWHEAVHYNISSHRFVNDAAGVLGAFPYMAPFYLEKWFHLQHHALLNQRSDPNYIYMDGPFWTLPLRYPRVFRYARARMRDDPRGPGQHLSDRVAVIVVVCCYALAWWLGIFWALVALWFVPVVISKFVMDWYVNYLPHVGLPPHRFRGTRIIDAPWLTFALLGHNYHAIHHLWPSIPWHQYRATFVRKRDYLREHGVPIEPRLTFARIEEHETNRPDTLSG
jgi:fatty acid desaturase